MAAPKNPAPPHAHTTDRAGDPLGVALVLEQVGDEDALKDIFGADRLLRRLLGHHRSQAPRLGSIGIDRNRLARCGSLTPMVAHFRRSINVVSF